MKKFKNKKLIVNIIIIIAVCFFAEIAISSFSNICLMLSGAEEKTLSLSSARIIDGKESSINDDVIYLKGGVLFFEDINEEMKNICIEMSNDDGEYVDVELSYTDDNFAFDDGYTYNVAKTSMLAGDSEQNFYSVSSFGEVKGLKINIKDSSDLIEISSIKLNAFKPFHISLFRFIILLTICFIIRFKLWNIAYSPKKSFGIAVSALMMCTAVIGLMSLMNLSNPSVTLLEEYPSENISSQDQYRQLFEAFSNGHIDLDIDYDTSKLDSLENPYDRSERNEADLHGDFWDRAYYNGKFYSYFGVSPVFTVYFPVFFLTGHAPSTLLASGIMCIYAIIFISLLYNFVINKFCEGAPSVAVILGHIALIFGSLIFALAAENQFYYLAVVSGIAWLAAFFYFILKAYYENNLKKRIIFLAVTGISVVMIVASRPSLILYCISAIVPAIFIFSDKHEKTKNKILYIISIGTPVVIGAVLIMIYNYLRFENPFEFGFNYQLTVSMAEANTITLSMLPAALYHYFVQQPRVSSIFPYIEIKGHSLEAYSRYTYVGRTMGILNYPLTWGLFFAPFAVSKKDKKDKFKSFFLGVITVTALILAFVDMCTAGSHYRYTADILMPLLLVSIVVVFNILQMLKSAPAKIYNLAYIFTILAMSATVIIGYLMIFANESEKLMKQYPLAVDFLRSL